MTEYNQKMMRRFEEGLRRGGGLYTPQDIIDACRDGEMQMWTHEDSFAVTQIVNFPRKRILNVVLVVGHMKDLDSIWPNVLQFAQDVAVDFVRAVGRPGWINVIPRWGFHPISSVWVREIE